MNRASLERPQSVLDEPRFVQRIGVNRDLHVEFVGDAETCVDRGRSGSPVLVKFQSDRARADLLPQRLGCRTIALCRGIPRFIGYSSAASSMR